MSYSISWPDRSGHLFELLRSGGCTVPDPDAFGNLVKRI